MDGIKQLAKKIHREHNITHTKALEVASHQAGYENFVHAKRQLVGAVASRGFPVYLSVHWRAPRERNGEPKPDGPRAGREILRVDLARPLPEIVAKHRVSHGRGLSGFGMEYEDHLEHLTNVQGQDGGRKVLLTAVRSLRFMEATGLQPVLTQRCRDLLRTLEKMPGRDHQSQWFDPATEGYVFLDEPYAAALKNHSAERQLWLERNGLQMVAPEWEGIYYPGECLPRLIGPDGALLQRVADALAKVQPCWSRRRGRTKQAFVETTSSVQSAKLMRKRAARGPGRLGGSTKALRLTEVLQVSPRAGGRPSQCHSICTSSSAP